MNTYLYGQSVYVTYPHTPGVMARFIVARNDFNLPYLFCVNDSFRSNDEFNARYGIKPQTQGDSFTCEGVPFSVSDEPFLSVGETAHISKTAING